MCRWRWRRRGCAAFEGSCNVVSYNLRKRAWNCRELLFLTGVRLVGEGIKIMTINKVSWRVAAAFAVFLATAASALGQANFPLKPGEWESTTSFSNPKGGTVKERLCLSDVLWARRLIQSQVPTGDSSDPHCSILPSVSATGVSGSGTCTFKMQTQVRKMSGPNPYGEPVTDEHNFRTTLEINFDGMTHMTGKGKVIDEVTYIPLTPTEHSITSGTTYYSQVGPERTVTNPMGDLRIDLIWKRDTCGRKSLKF